MAETKVSSQNSNGPTAYKQRRGPMFANRKDKYNKEASKQANEEVKKRKAEGTLHKYKPYKSPTDKKREVPTEDTSELQVTGSRGQQQKRLRVERQQTQATGDLKIQARKLWEVLRRGDLEDDQRQKKMEEMMDLLRGRFKEVTFKHDMSRIVQSCVKHGNEEQRMEIALELKGSYVELSRSLYGRHILMRLLKYSPKCRADIIRSFYGHVRKLIRHKDAAVVLEECYAVYSNAGQRWNLAAELYGSEFAIFKDSGDGGPKSLDAVLEKTPQKRATVLASLKGTLKPLLEKGTVQHSIVHRALLDYLRHVQDTGDRQEMIEAMRELVVEVLHTREGAHAGMLCLLHGNNKDRKAILKSFKPYLQRICCEEYGYAVLVEALDCLDDTVFVNKTLLQDVCSLMDQLLGDQYGRRIPLYILGGRSPHYVGSDALQVLVKNDEIKAATSKKDPAVRRRELTAHISPTMIKWASEHVVEALFDAMPSQAICETLLRAHGDKTMLWERVLDLVTASVNDLGDTHVLINPIANRVVANCIIAEHSRPKSADSTLPSLPESNPSFGTDVLDALVRSNQLVDAACAAAFPVRALLESPVTAKRTKSLLSPHVKSITSAMTGAKHRKRVYEAILQLLA
ncbi:ARM repeat-containing protein [Coemansia reversa NRRL 1564]|uniref:ARM repeat-containing protein n=1 Tax=Coemansia reversa (strain ATCC 12441 / NRRL 1564) TaxID=763665 RepID=A0A2G5BFH9_COERN|nr:ARM repeat-containing protein [Coemansia reversa NRRL 1564]|eukprot:PIA17763.1 ARM repeat-containing protein [Coemansia reversa NRRL 1564]